MNVVAHSEGTLPSVWLASDLRMVPHQTKLPCMQVKGALPHTIKPGLLSLGANLAKARCDFVEKLWKGEEGLKIPITNWTTEPIVIVMDQIV